LPALSSSDPAALAANLARGDQLLGGAAAGRHWLQKVARVRTSIASLERTRLAGRAIGAAAPPRLRVVQLPAVAGEAWVGASALVSGTRLNLALLSPAVFDPSLPIAGVMLDEWVEVVPVASQTTGLAFHVDTPGAQAPQSILLALAPDPSASGWSTDMIENALTEALTLAKVRTVDPEALTDVGQLLPALYVPNNVAGDTASTEILPA
jgi:hypothetical protein